MSFAVFRTLGKRSFLKTFGGANSLVSLGKRGCAGRVGLMAEPDLVESFITRWGSSGAAERANYQMFLAELCDVLGVPRPEPTLPDPGRNLYVFDRAISRMNPDGSTVTNYIDFYKAGHFVWETKQGSSGERGGISGGDHRSPFLGETTRTANSSPPPAAKSGHGRRGSSAFDRALERAYHQARDYIPHLPAAHGRPPFLVVCDVGHSIDLYAEFTCTGGRYERFPDPKNHRILLADLRRPEIRERLRLVFTDPQSLDPSKRAAEVTRDIADRLARLAKSLEAAGHDPQVIAGFLQRCLFTMFAEDIGLLPDGGFHRLLEKARENPQGFPVLVSGLWREMATGTSYSALLFQEIAQFNGGLFETTTALDLDGGQIAMLADAAASDWSGVEPSIFGTLLVRALDPRERHKLGAEFTPRSYVERLIRPTILDPLREEWDATRIAAAKLHADAEAALDAADAKEREAKQQLAAGQNAAAKQSGADARKFRASAAKKDAEALDLVTAYHRHLCRLQFLDPACGTANFLYVTLEHMKRLEAEVLELATALGGDATFEMGEYKVRPDQFLGLELAPNAVAIAQLVLWIGYFQWQRKTTGKADTGDRPLLPKTQSIRQQDAVLAYDERIPRKDPESGEILTIWDGHTTKPHPVTGKEVPDESARAVLFDYVNPRRAEWPKADYIVGNPPFIGASRMREALGDGYTEALRKAWKGSVPESADFVMFWWCKAADETAQGRCKRFGFITTNSIHQTFNRRVIEPFLADTKKPLHLAYAIPDHPWIDSADGAAVRIAMTVAAPGKGEGALDEVTDEMPMEHGECDVELERETGTIAANLRVGVDVTSCVALRANSKLAHRGVQTIGSGFIVTPEVAESLGLGNDSGIEKHIRGYQNGKDITDKPRGVRVIDLYGLSVSEVEEHWPSLYQHLFVNVKPERDQNNRASYRKNWWIHGEPRKDLRAALRGLSRYIATSETSRHRFFIFLDHGVLPDNMLIAIAIDDAFHLALLSSKLHILWALAAGGRLGLGNDPRYNKTRCFDPFPFPAIDEGELKQRIRDLGERLDAHRKRQQELHPGLTLTGMYNVLEKLRAGEPLTAKDKTIHEQGLVTLLKQIHEELDEAVLEAYGWHDIVEARRALPHVYDFEAGCVTTTMEIPQDEFAEHMRKSRERIEREILTRLVALNHERAAEEQRGLVRWLRPEYQSAGDPQPPSQGELPGTEVAASPKSGVSKSGSTSWPKRLPEQVAVIRQILASDPGASAEDLSARFGRKSAKREDQIQGILETLRDLGQGGRMKAES